MSNIWLIVTCQWVGDNCCQLNNIHISLSVSFSYYVFINDKSQKWEVIERIWVWQTLKDELNEMQKNANVVMTLICDILDFQMLPRVAMLKSMCNINMIV